jgi:hypothetical protein
MSQTTVKTRTIRSDYEEVNETIGYINSARTLETLDSICRIQVVPVLEKVAGVHGERLEAIRVAITEARKVLSDVVNNKVERTAALDAYVALGDALDELG